MKDAKPTFERIVRPSNEKAARRPFPLDVLPDEVRQYALAVADSRSVDVSVPAALSLVAMGTAIGLSRVYYDDFASWEEVPMIWLAVVNPSGRRKTVVIDDFFQAHTERQRQLYEAYLSEKAAYDGAFAEWERLTKSKKKDLEPPPPPVEPRMEHVYTTNTTPESLIGMLQASPRGLTLICDELSTFFGSLGRYAGRADGDRGMYLSLFRGTGCKVDRKGAGSVLIGKTAASIVGSVQPGILSTLFDRGTFESGMASRFLLVSPPAMVKQYRQGPTENQRAKYRELIDALFGLPLDTFSKEDGDLGVQPLRVALSEGARQVLTDFIPKWSAESLTSKSSVEAAMSKLEAYALRFALILRCCREATGDSPETEMVRQDDLRAGIELAQWFREEMVVVYEDMVSAEAAGSRDPLTARAEIIRARCDGAVTAREWRKRNTRRTSEEARGELEELVRAGLAVWRKRESGVAGGRPAEECAVLPEGSREGFGVQGCELQEVAGFGLRDAKLGASLDAAGQSSHGRPGGGGGPGDSHPPVEERNPKSPTEDPTSLSAEIPSNPQPATRNPANDGDHDDEGGDGSEEVVEWRG